MHAMDVRDPNPSSRALTAGALTTEPSLQCSIAYEDSDTIESYQELDFATRRMSTCTLKRGAEWKWSHTQSPVYTRLHPVHVGT